MLGHRDPQPGAPGTSRLAQRLDTPAGLVAVAHSRLVLVLQHRQRQPLEQRREPRQPAGQRTGGDGQSLMRQRHRHPVQGTIAQGALEQNMRPHGGAVGRAGEHPVRRRRRDMPRGIGTVAPPAPAGTDDAPCMRLHVDFDDRAGTLAVGHIRGTAAATHACFRRRLVDFDPFLKPRPRGAAMAGSARLLAAPARRAELVLLLAPAPVQPLRQYGPTRTNLR